MSTHDPMFSIKLGYLSGTSDQMLTLINQFCSELERRLNRFAKEVVNFSVTISPYGDTLSITASYTEGAIEPAWYGEEGSEDRELITPESVSRRLNKDFQIYKLCWESLSWVSFVLRGSQIQAKHHGRFSDE